MREGLDARITVLQPGGFQLDAELRLESGRTVAVLGPNGAGKSTLIAALAGLLRLHEGRVTLDGRVLKSCCFSNSVCGAWSVAITSKTPSINPSSRRSLSCLVRSGGFIFRLAS